MQYLLLLYWPKTIAPVPPILCGFVVKLAVPALNVPEEETPPRKNKLPEKIMAVDVQDPVTDTAPINV